MILSRLTRPKLIKFYVWGSIQLTQKYYSSFVGKNFATLKDFDSNEIQKFLWTANDLKTRFKKDKECFQPLHGKSIGLIFQKRSTRTRVSTETGMGLLGGQSVFLGASDVHIGVSESLEDSAKVLSSMFDILLARVFEHDIIDTLAAASSVPVINGLSDLYHPLQILADFLTLQEHFGRLKDLKLSWVGFAPDENVIKICDKIASQTGSLLHYTHDPKEAVHQANAIITDTWVSMGQEKEKERKIKLFADYIVNDELVKGAAPNWVFMHCLPRYPLEVTDSVFYAKNSVVFQEAENRKWTVMAVMLHLLQDYSPVYPKPNFGF
ncbi:OTC [Acanthosepion pharaonis]|uniref:ornithine carbamoyltransferase n=1 Tax=Acanthosepion pharaonis TaxID=158019 RepID=A0A812C8Q4_ACAPH|nr:OTC [Sepia pharaonis]